jgi:outer membrane receptor protein involved in Fe transport
MTAQKISLRQALLTSAVLMAPSLLAPMAHAQSEPAEATGEEEVVVTARRSSEKFIQVPVQVNVATAAQLTRVNATNLEKISENIPFVSITKLPAGNGGAFNIRGIGNYGTDTGVQQSVLLSIDDTFIGRPRVANGAMFDLKQVEVLKGPQSLFYGKNTVAGVVSVTSADPTDTFSAQAAAGYEFEAREKYVEGAVSGPITDTLTARLALRFDETEGWIDNVATARTNPLLPGLIMPGPERDRGPFSRDIAGRLTLLWEPSDDFQAKFKYFHGDNSNDGETGSIEIFCRPGIQFYTEFGIPDTQTDCKANGVRALNNYPASRVAGMPGANGGIADAGYVSDLSSLKLVYSTGPITLTSVTGYYKLDTESASNLSFSSLATTWAAIQEQSDGFSQELRLSTDFEGPLNFMAGAFLSDNKTYYNSNVTLFPFVPEYRGSFESYRRFSDLSTRTYSAFVQARWDIREDVKLEAGIRYSSEKISATDGNSYANPALLFLLRPEGVYFVRSKTETDFSPEVTLTWFPDDHQTLYVAYKTGNKPGGYSFPALATVAFTEANTNFLSESVEGFEAGYKAEFLDRDLRFSVTGYHFEYKNQQVSTFDPSILSFTVKNAAGSTLQGIEAEATWAPSSDLSFQAALGYNDAHYDEYRGVQCYAAQTVAEGCVNRQQDLSGRTLPRSPEWAGSLGVTYEPSITDELTLLMSANGIYTGKYNAGDTLDPFLEIDGYWRFNASLAVGDADGNWEVGVYGRNLTNEYKPLTAGDKAFGQPGTYNGPFTRSREILAAIKVQY